MLRYAIPSLAGSAAFLYVYRIYRRGLAPGMDPEAPRASRQVRRLRHGVHEGLVRRVRGEYREMPGLSPTLAQAQRLFGVDEMTCRAILESLVGARFLSRDSQGRYVRNDLAS